MKENFGYSPFQRCFNGDLYSPDKIRKILKLYHGSRDGHLEGVTLTSGSITFVDPSHKELEELISDRAPASIFITEEDKGIETIFIPSKRGYICLKEEIEPEPETTAAVLIP